MADDLTNEKLAAIERRDEWAGQGAAVFDPLVFEDRHILLTEVRKLRAANERRRAGRPVAN